jgi:hypothetical protein
MLASTATGLCRDAKDRYGRLQTLPLPGYPLRAFGPVQAVGASLLLSDFYTHIQMTGACTTCADEVYRTLPVRDTLGPEVCASDTRQALVDHIRAYLSGQSDPGLAAVAFLGGNFEQLAFALEREGATNPLISWLALTAMLDRRADTVAVAAAVVHLAKRGSTPAIRAAATTAAQAIGALPGGSPPSTIPPGTLPAAQSSVGAGTILLVGLGLAAIIGLVAGRYHR